MIITVCLIPLDATQKYVVGMKNDGFSEISAKSINFLMLIFFMDLAEI